MQRIDTMVKELGFDGYFQTSAREGWQIEELAETIRKAIDWKAMPSVSSTELFQKIKAFLVNEKQAGRLLSSVEDLFTALESCRVLEVSIIDALKTAAALKTRATSFVRLAKAEVCLERSTA
jgi:hypothetical protein